MKNVEFSSKLERAHTTQFQAKSRILGEQAAAAAATKKKKKHSSGTLNISTQEEE